MYSTKTRKIISKTVASGVGQRYDGRKSVQENYEILPDRVDFADILDILNNLGLSDSFGGFYCTSQLNAYTARDRARWMSARTKSFDDFFV